MKIKQMLLSIKLKILRYKLTLFIWLLKKLIYCKLWLRHTSESEALI